MTFDACGGSPTRGGAPSLKGKILDMQTLPGRGRTCEDCGHHVATVLIGLDVAGPRVAVCGLCALAVLLSGADDYFEWDGD